LAADESLEPKGRKEKYTLSTFSKGQLSTKFEFISFHELSYSPGFGNPIIAISNFGFVR
jgi:hypothetical protein